MVYFYKKNEDIPNGYIRYLLVEIVTNEGKTVTGMRINEDAFSIQLRDAANQFHSFKKADLKELNKLFHA